MCGGGGGQGETVLIAQSIAMMGRWVTHNAPPNGKVHCKPVPTPRIPASVQVGKGKTELGLPSMHCSSPSPSAPARGKWGKLGNNAALWGRKPPAPTDAPIQKQSRLNVTPQWPKRGLRTAQPLAWMLY